ncbi:hypothetical protein SLS54_003397 [Diplodia seriata]
MESYQLEMCWSHGQMGLDEGDVLYFVWTQSTSPRSHSNYHTYYRMQLWDIDFLDTNMSIWFPDGRNWFADQGVRDVVEGRTDSVRSKNLAKGWFTRCEENADGTHDECNAFIAKSRPTRVLDVEHARESSRLRLVCVEDAPGDRYITLSHCWGAWGAKELPMLTTANLEERQNEGMDVSDLPQTFRDALEVASWYNVKWLWIDSLCIIQDSPSDWFREASLMARTYKHAVLNISADHFQDARGGLFTDRNPFDTVPIQFHATKSPGVMPSSGADLARSWWMYDYETDAFGWAIRAPSFARAWIHRERQLARRVLHFTAAEIVWECCASRAPGQALASETFPGGYPFRRLLSGQSKWQARDVRNSGEDAVLETWNEVCEGFSKKWLTVRSDMPIILSSLAEEFAEMLPGDAYVAGHWESTLPLSLLWKVDRWPGTDTGEFSAQPHAMEKRWIDQVCRKTAEEILRDQPEILDEPDEKTEENGRAGTSSRVTGIFVRAKMIARELAAQRASSGEALLVHPTAGDSPDTHVEAALESITTQPETTQLGSTESEGTEPEMTGQESIEAETNQLEMAQPETRQHDESEQDDQGSELGVYFDYIGPSWSWFSISGSTLHHGRWPQVPLATARVDDPARLRNAFGPFVPAASGLTLTGYMRRVEVVFTGTDMVESLYTPDIVALRHKFTMVVIDHDDGDADADLRRKGPDGLPRGVRVVGKAWRQQTGKDFEVKLDFPRGDDQRLLCYCLFVGFHGKKRTKYDLAVHGLLLEPAEGREGFRRIGLIDMTAMTALRMRYMVQEGEEEPDEEGWKAVMSWLQSVEVSPDKDEFNEKGPEALYWRDEERPGLKRLRMRDIKLM